MESVGKKQNLNPNEEINKLLISKIEEFLERFGIKYLGHREEAGSIIFSIELPEDHVRQYAEALKNHFLNEGIKTDFTEKHLMPFVRKFTEQYNDYFDFSFISLKKTDQKFREFKVTKRALV